MFAAATKPIAIATAGNTKARHINQKGNPMDAEQEKRLDEAAEMIAQSMFLLGMTKSVVDQLKATEAEESEK